VPILFALDRAEGAGKRQPVSAGKLVLTCPLDNCRHQADDQKKLYERMMEIYAGYLEHPVNNLCFDFAWVVAYSCVGE
jgi:hypothetical protein